MAKAWKVNGIRPQSSFRWGAQLILAVRVEEVYSVGRFHSQPR